MKSKPINSQKLAKTGIPLHSGRREETSQLKPMSAPRVGRITSSLEEDAETSIFDSKPLKSHTQLPPVVIQKDIFDHPDVMPEIFVQAKDSEVSKNHDICED